MGLRLRLVKSFSGNFAFVVFLIHINVQSDTEKGGF